MRKAALLLLSALAACGSVGRDCSLAARLAAHAEERAAFRRAILPLVAFRPCPSTHPEELIPEENRIAAYEQRLRQRIGASELSGDLAEARREAQRAAENMSVDCVGVRWSGEQYVRESRQSLAREMEQLRAIEARFEDLARRLAEC